MTATLTDRSPRVERLAALLRVPVRNALAERADAIRSSLPPRPLDTRACFIWLHSLDQDQARRAALLDRLTALCEHVSGRPALGYEPGDPLPAAALEEADGFTDTATALLVAEYRARRAVSAG
ncbi:hypothetical protein [Streptomyces sp. ISL-100]|uniref:hypothetical protein n=1 Tax=Streptomyces sp. ISL-100 TaxID=2819173 RepID=UPI001BE7A1A1|nr:hypothetical protein [Streptomyces sp. ISL-100]MBT2396280.1 hypothetical protein [Streptomyces sp. ISL-100]